MSSVLVVLLPLYDKGNPAGTVFGTMLTIVKGRDLQAVTIIGDKTVPAGVRYPLYAAVSNTVLRAAASSEHRALTCWQVAGDTLHNSVWGAAVVRCYGCGRYVFGKNRQVTAVLVLPVHAQMPTPPAPRYGQQPWRGESSLKQGYLPENHTKLCEPLGSRRRTASQPAPRAGMHQHLQQQEQQQQTTARTSGSDAV
jgi:hypothetical protein